MKPATFEYHAPTTIDEVVALLEAHGDEAKPLAGGQSLVPLLSMRLTRFEHLIDLNNIQELQGIERNDGHLVVRTMTRQREAERSPEVAAAVPLLTAAIPHIGHFQIRNRGTVGGSIAHADPASELPAVALALDAELELDGGDGPRTVAAADFFESTWSTAVGPDELLVRARFPIWSGRQGVAVEEFARRAGDFAIVGVVVAVALNDAGQVDKAGMALFGMGSTPVRASQAEMALVGQAPPDAAGLGEIGRLAVADADPTDDLHASAVHRNLVGAHLATRALTRAFEEASLV